MCVGLVGRSEWLSPKCEGGQKMLSRKKQNGRDMQAGQQNVLRQMAGQQPTLAAKRRRHLPPFFFRLGPVALSIFSVLLIGLMAVLYLSQLGQAVPANREIQNFHTQPALLEPENQDLHYQIAQVQSHVCLAGLAGS